MTLAEMQQMTINHWRRHFPARVRAMGEKKTLDQAKACANLTRKAMDDLKEVGLDEETAWTETRNLYCLAPPPKSDHLQTAR
jgi:hypothetical protein